MSCECNTKTKLIVTCLTLSMNSWQQAFNSFLLHNNYVNANTFLAVQLYCIIHVYLNNTYMPVVFSVYHCQ